MSNETIGRIGWWPLCAALLCMPLCALFGALAGFAGSEVLAAVSKACMLGMVYGVPAGTVWCVVVAIVAWAFGRAVLD